METHHKPHVHHNKKWKDYFFEFLMLFLAVTAGFFMENEREHYVEKQRAKQYAGNLIYDLKKDTAMMGLEIVHIKRITSKIDRLASFLQGKKINEISNSQLFGYSPADCLYKPFTWSRATLEEIKNSGSLRYFENDSLIMKISAYDAYTKHLDEDFNGDTQRNDKIAEKKSRIVDLNYQLHDSISSWMVPDSLSRLVLQKQISNGQPDLQLLTNNINDVKSLMNDYLIVKEHLKIRGEMELPQLIGEAEQLILMLKNEYHLQ